jgi:hypothetical protein
MSQATQRTTNSTFEQKEVSAIPPAFRLSNGELWIDRRRVTISRSTETEVERQQTRIIVETAQHVQAQREIARQRLVAERTEP